jgi:hypothetical protein
MSDEQMSSAGANLPARLLIAHCSLLLLTDPHGLGVYEFPDAYHSQFTSVP